MWDLRFRDKQRIEAAQMRFSRGLKGVTLRYSQMRTRNLSKFNKMTDNLKEYQKN
jgi:hypothetical protein